MESVTPPLLSPAKRQKFTLFLKIGGICFLILLLHVPLAMTDGVLRERNGYRDEAVSQIAAVWGGWQKINGPVLAVPYTYRGQVTRTKMINGNAVQVDEASVITGTAFFLPEDLKVTGTMSPEVRYRGIHEAIVYTAQLRLSGSFEPDFGKLGITTEAIGWDKARVLFGVADGKGIRSVTPLKIDDAAPASFEPAGAAGCEGLSLSAPATGAASGKKLGFELDLVLQGSGGLDVTPTGKSTTVRLGAPWADPSFTGSSLPVERTVRADGFEAEWQSTHFSRSFAQSWTSRQTELKNALQSMSASAFGVEFAQPVDGYRQAERAQKYGVLFFVLVFAVFFLFEVTAPLRIHPLQYAMVGAALCLFFLGFLALSEFLPTGIAYGIAAAACTAMVAFYSMSVLKSGRRTAVVAGGLAATYGYLYFVLKSQDYALLAGTAALFIALAIVMFFTRRIDWYSLEMNTAAGCAK
jgi:inner membrane protein